MGAITKTWTYYKSGTNKKSWIKITATLEAIRISTTQHKFSAKMTYTCNYSPSKTYKRSADVAIADSAGDYLAGADFSFTGYSKATNAKTIGTWQYTLTSNASSAKVDVGVVLPGNMTNGGGSILCGTVSVPLDEIVKPTPANYISVWGTKGPQVPIEINVDNIICEIARKEIDSNARHNIDLIIDNLIVPVLSHDSDNGTTPRYDTGKKISIDALKYISNGTTKVAQVKITTYDARYPSSPSVGTTYGTANITIRNIDKPDIQNIKWAPFTAEGDKMDRLISGYSTLRVVVTPKETETTQDPTYTYDKPKSISVKLHNTTISSTNFEDGVFAVDIPITVAYPSTPVIVTYTDTRNNQTTELIDAGKTYKYTNPAIIDYEAVRCFSNGTVNKQGENIRIKLNTVYAECGGEIDGKFGNSLQYKLFYSTDGGAEYTEFENINSHEMDFEKIYPNFSSEITYIFKAIIIDEFGNSAEINFDIGSSEVLMDMYKKTVSFGAAASRTNEEMYPDGAFEVVLPTYLEHVSELIMLSPNGTKYKLIVDDSGNLSTVEMI